MDGVEMNAHRGSHEILVAGVGFRIGCNDDDLADLIMDHLRPYGLSPEHLSALATGWMKDKSPAIHMLAKQWQLPLMIIGREEMMSVSPRCLTKSKWVARQFGLPVSVAEASALAAAGPQSALLGPRSAKYGGACALAKG